MDGRKFMVEFLRKRGIKIALVNSFLITKSSNLQIFALIFYSVGSPFLGKYKSRGDKIARVN